MTDQLTLGRSEYEAAYAKRYEDLNSEQQKAVDTIEGPVLVLAGPGTGKTELLGMRIGNILRQTQLSPGNILCLTFTDAAVSEMRSRLTEIIGPDANRVAVFTFHSFCHEVLNEYPEYFETVSSESELITELEQVALIRRGIDELPHGDPYKPVSTPYLNVKLFIGAISDLKREQISPKLLATSINEESEFAAKYAELFDTFLATRATSLKREDFEQLVETLSSGPYSDYRLTTEITKIVAGFLNSDLEEKIWKKHRTTVKSQLKKLFDKHIAPRAIAKQRSLLQMYNYYQEQLKQTRRIDFNDMINFVVEGFEQNEELLRIYQERFQYILVDEYQDTNTSQNKTVALLASYFDRPNVFAVGDDDQSIFRFQGASLENVLYFSSQFGDAEVIPLNKNYRSQQTILDAATELIGNNTNRAVTFLKDSITKTLIAANPERTPKQLRHISYATALEELHGVADEIARLVNDGAEAENIAVIVQKNKHAADLAEVLSARKIAYKLDKGENVLNNTFVQRLMQLLRFISDPTREGLLFQILAWEVFELSSRDLVLVLKETRNNRIELWDFLNSEAVTKLDLGQPEAITRAVARLAEWIRLGGSEDAHTTLRTLLAGDDGIISYLSSRDDSLHIMIRLFKLEHELSELEELHDGTYMLEDFVSDIDLYEEYNIQITEKTISAHDDAVTITTAHSSKGHQYDHVFIIKGVKSIWDKEISSSRMTIPVGLLSTQELQDTKDEERRLFFVALTRARHTVTLTSYKQDDNGRDQNVSNFINELPASAIDASEISNNEASMQQILSVTLGASLQPVITESNRAIIKDLLAGYRLSPTDFIAYRNSPRKFFYEKVLRLPAEPSIYLVFGNAVHAVMKQAVMQLQNGETPEWKSLESVFTKEVNGSRLLQPDKEYLASAGVQRLNKFLDNELQNLQTGALVEYSFLQHKPSIGQVPLTGKIDRFDYTDSSKTSGKVIDYKTGNPESLSGKISVRKKSGDYIDQLRFYKLLIENSPLGATVSEGVIKYIDPNKNGEFVEFAFSFDDDEMSAFADEVSEVYQSIMNLEFEEKGNMKDEWYSDFGIAL